MENNLNQFLTKNNINKEEMESILFSAILNSLFEELIKYIKKNTLENKVKLSIQNAYSIREELFILSDLLKEFTPLSINSDQLEFLLINLKAYFSKSNYRTPLPTKIKTDILERQSLKCNYCSKKISLDNAHFDHIIAFKWVGDELTDNFQGLCIDCNLAKGVNTFYALKSFLFKNKL
ncbi:HNH endonuclease [Planococcus sp. APC 3900]|uniref:HNH endonuclease n=1 Tax=Planococcus sp. APC 3900 TaxID=3035191 RepID=UPI0025B4142A|nr:HNH endonuclease [Planococcus sp. APC 3900]MDN3439967.1 HNH endonuclease [Planococcus sp. APC 3900]